MSTDHRELELTLDVPDDWDLGDAARLVPSGGRVELATVDLESTFFDTEDRDLLRAGCTLRRRTGEIDAGWQLKVPDGDARLEIGVALGSPGGSRSRGVPPELRAITAGIRGGAALRRVAVIRTHRRLARLVDPDGSCIAELALDEVDAGEFREFVITRRWRELEVELVDGGPKQLARIVRRLEAEGAAPARYQSKLVRALDAEPRARSTPDTLAGLVRGYLEAQYAELVRGDIGLRRDENRVHTTRVAIRRYRTALREFAALFDDDRRHRLDDDLRGYAAVLGQVRDAHVLRESLAARVDALTVEGGADGVAVAGVRTVIERRLAAELDSAHDELTRHLRSRRHLALMRELAEWRIDPPIVRDKRARAVAKVLARSEHRARRQRRRAPAAVDFDLALHAARKAVKRSRYVAELARPVLGADAETVRRKAKRWQSRLGDHQDGVVAEAFLRRILNDLSSRERTAFALGILYASDSGSAGAR